MKNVLLYMASEMVLSKIKMLYNLPDEIFLFTLPWMLWALILTYHIRSWLKGNGATYDRQ